MSVAAPPTSESGPWQRWAAWSRSNIGLLVTPVVLVGAGVWLYVYNQNADKIEQDRLALDWDGNLSPQIQEHLSLTLKSTALVLLIAIPLGIFLTRPRFRFLAGPFLAVANTGQAVPAYGLFVLFFAWLGRGETTAVYALTFFTILPVLRNTMVGLDQVDAAVIEAGRGMGLTKRQALTRIELPLSVPVMLAGVRTALVINVGMAALAFLIGAGGLGETIFAGIQLQRDLVLITGAVLVAIIALSVDWLAAIAEKILRPRGL